MKSKLTKIGFMIFLILIITFSVNVNATTLNGFYKIDNYTYYYENGEIQKGIKKIGEKHYFLGEYSGKLQFGLITSSFTGNTYYANEEGILQTGFVKVSGSTYYFNEEGVLQKGITKINDNYYFLGEYSGKVQVGLVTSSFTGNTYITDKTGMIQTGFIEYENSNYYLNEEGIIQKGITKINDKYYFLGEYSGKVQVGLVTSSLSGKKYFANKDGSLHHGIKVIDNKRYFFDEISGELRYGFITDTNNNNYYANKNGVLLTGEHKINNTKYKFTEEGLLYVGFMQQDGYTYYYINGYSQKGITAIDGVDYFLGEYSGKVQIGWVTSSLTNDTYYTNESGIIQKGITVIDGEEYFLGEYSGKVQTGLIKSSINNFYYYTDDTGKIYKNTFTINEKTYYADSTGKLYEGFIAIGNETYYFIKGEKQLGITKINGEEYFLGEYTGKVCYGWITSSITNDKYYTNENGVIQKGIKNIDGTTYFLGEYSGKLQIGWVHALTGKIYYTDTNGIIQTGVQTIDNIQYVFDENGVIKTGFQTIGDKTYYYTTTGQALTGVHKIHGIRYRFATDGVLKESNFKLILDVSYHQGTIDWDALWNSQEIDGVILRIGYNGIEDKKFSEYLSNVKRLNIPYGVYLFSYAHNPSEAIFEANATLNMLKKYNVNPTYPVYYDIESYRIASTGESSDDITKEAYEGMIANYLNVLRSNGYTAKVYTGLNYAMTRLTANSRNEVEWIAHYTTGDCGYQLPHKGWQYTSSGKVTGVNGNVDLSIFYY